MVDLRRLTSIPFLRSVAATLLDSILRIGKGLQDKLVNRLARWVPAEGSQTNISLWRGYTPVALVALVGMVISIAVFTQSLSWEESRVETDFREASQDRILVIQRAVSGSIGIVQDIASYIAGSDLIGRREFRKYVGPAIKRQAGIRSLEWVPVVYDADRSAFVESARLSFSPFMIGEIDNSGSLIESMARPIYYPVLYVQPYKKNKDRLGLDLGTDPMMIALFKKAQASHEPQVSHVISLPPDEGLGMGMMVVVPVYYNEDDELELPETDGKQIRGFAIGTFYVGPVIERALESLQSGGVDLHFFTTGDDGERHLLYTHLSRLRSGKEPEVDEEQGDLVFHQKIRAGEWPWEVVCNPAVDRFVADTWLSWIILLGGFSFTALLTVYLMTLVGRERQVRLEVAERTSQLRQAVHALNRQVFERKLAELELQTLNETLEHHVANRTAEAERRAQYLEQFAYVASHDLKAPLRAVSNLAQWIEEDLTDKLDEGSKEQMALLRDRVRRMHDLIEGLLEYSRVGGSKSSESQVNTRELVNEIIDSLSPPKGFKIKVQTEMPTLYTDRLQLGQVFSNLISNSLKHHGGTRGKIRVSCESFGKGYQFTVCDDGQGIAPEYHSKVFMMFQTLRATDMESSTGIGLALVKKIVEEQGGSISLASDVGKGACFTFTWPNKKPPG